MQLVANLANINNVKNLEMSETQAFGYSSESTQRYPINTNITGFRLFSKIFAELWLVLWTKVTSALKTLSIAKKVNRDTSRIVKHVTRCLWFKG